MDRNLAVLFAWVPQAFAASLTVSKPWEHHCERSLEARPQIKKTLPDRYLSYVFDGLHLKLGHSAQTRAAAERVFTELLDSGTRTAILTTSGEVSLGFTNDRSKLVAAFNRLRPNAIPRGECPEVSHYMADQIVRFEGCGGAE